MYSSFEEFPFVCRVPLEGQAPSEREALWAGQGCLESLESRDSLEFREKS